MPKQSEKRLENRNLRSRFTKISNPKLREKKIELILFLVIFSFNISQQNNVDRKTGFGQSIPKNRFSIRLFGSVKQTIMQCGFRKCFRVKEKKIDLSKYEFQQCDRTQFQFYWTSV